MFNFGGQQPVASGTAQAPAFSGFATQPTTTVNTAPTSIFGSKSTIASTVAPVISGFGNQQAGASGTTPALTFTGFATQPTTTVNTAPTSTTIFGSKQTLASSVAPVLSGFGNQQAAAPSTTPAPMFSGFATQPATTVNTLPTSTSFFGSKQTIASTAAPVISGFGNQQTAASSTTPVPAFSGFATQPATTVNTALTSIFGSKQTIASSAAPVLSGFGNQQAGASGTTPASTFSGFTTQPTTTVNTAPASIFSSKQTIASTAAPVLSGFGNQQAAASGTAQAPAFSGFPTQPTTTVNAAPTSMPVLGGTATPLKTTPVPSVFGASNDAAKMSYKDLEQVLKGLRMDFETQEKQFLDEVDDLNAYDNILRKAQDKIGNLGCDIDELEQEKDRFKYELQVVEQQQTELDNLVTEMEKVLGLPDYTQGQPIGIREPTTATAADMQRQNILQLQITVDAQLKQVDDDVTDICEQLLDLQKIGGYHGSESGNAEKDEQVAVVDQIRQILRKQIDTLGWVDKQSDNLNAKVKKIAAEVLTLQK